ncbi:uncharacterized protein LOC124916486 [Impatiens glandulifera]|uniref:uncharacterized protein LOC124916486 n=1 Tax=Impatiens glandulifera TaxID=253017 RepID=UPI001FB05DB7|nr:uncharacterized protein LOC124916486 [Impatiens glandulifera]XP_047313163.1 uncharacterized protein LOC124916486 [Impatiens glandulifera]
MDKLLKPYDKEFMKMAILKHEETFKQQVYELHRLYQIQKALMRGVKSSKPNNPLQGFLDLEKPQTNDDDGEEESEIELTLGPSSFNRSTKRTADQRRTPTSESGPSFSSSTSTTGSSHFKRKTTLTSTARIHDRITRNQELSFDVEKELNQSKIKHNPHWLYQTLSLNMT